MGSTIASAALIKGKFASWTKWYSFVVRSVGELDEFQPKFIHKLIFRSLRFRRFLYKISYPCQKLGFLFLKLYLLIFNSIDLSIRHFQLLDENGGKRDVFDKIKNAHGRYLSMTDVGDPWDINSIDEYLTLQQPDEKWVMIDGRLFKIRTDK